LINPNNDNDGTEDKVFKTTDMASRPALGPTKPPIQWMPGTLSPEIKRPGLQDNHLPPSSAEVKRASLWRGA
jgi:hypothetical protein